MGQSITLVEQFGAPTFTSLRTIGNTTVGNNLTVKNKFGCLLSLLYIYIQ